MSSVRDGRADAGSATEHLIGLLSDRELLGLLDGDAPAAALPLIPLLLARRVFTAGAVPRLGIPGVRFTDGARGVVLGRSTAFPVAIARAATWDPALEEQVGHAFGLEARVRGANYAASVCVNLLRHPAWGRAQESYGEDPVLAGRLGAAFTRGARPNVMVCVKHLACNSMEDARFEVDVRVDEHDLHEVYLPQFKAVLDAGADSVMSAYNAVNGTWMDANRSLLSDVLRDEWRFPGFVTSDWVFGTHDAMASLDAGLDIEMPLRLRRAQVLPGAAVRGRLPRALALRSARRIVRTCLQHAADRDPNEPAPGAVASTAHRRLARRAAADAMVLLQNDPVDGSPVLPLDPGLRRIAVVGRLADLPNLGDHGSSRVRPPSTSTPLQGLTEALPDAAVVTAHRDDPALAAEVAAGADAAVVVVGLGADDEGESVVTSGVDVGVLGRAFRSGPLRWVLAAVARVATGFVRGGDRRTLELRDSDARLVRAVAAANPRTVVVLVGGSAILSESWRRQVPALLLAWYPGMEGGRALADVLTGRAEPRGRLPFAVPTDAAHLPPFDRTARSVVYDAWFGQRRLDRDGHPAAFPFGSGLGYTMWTVELLDHRTDGATGTAHVRLRNTGTRTGATVAQVYAAERGPDRPTPRLLGFGKATVGPGEQAVLEVPLDLGPTLTRDPVSRRWSPRKGDWVVLAAESSPASLDGAHPLR